MNSLERMRLSKCFNNYMEYIKYVVGFCRNDFSWYEFGVFRGDSARLLLSLAPSKINIHLFDSFVGLPSKWKGREGYEKGHFNLNGEIPRFEDPRVVIHKGFFDKTLPIWCNNNKDFVDLIHIDCDIYISTKIVLQNLIHKIRQGTILLFDEFHGYDGYEINEYLAFNEFVEEYDIKYEFLAHTSSYQAAIRILNF